MRRLVSVGVIVGALVILAALGVAADGKDKLLFDRGLPSANLNNEAGALRSNVAWADWEPSADPKTGTPNEYWIPGDDFVIADAGQYKIRTIRVWIVGDNVPKCDREDGDDHREGRRSQLTLWGGTYTSGIHRLSTTCSVTDASYGDGITYQGNSGAMRQISQVDFKVEFDVKGGETVAFFVDGPWTLYSPDDPKSGVVNSFLHASNRLLSGGNQAGANDWFFFLHRKAGVTVGVETWNSMTGAGTQCAPATCSGWDKPSDANVQVFGEAHKK